MVIINDKVFDIYNLDTIESIMNRIAAKLKTLPKFLYFPNGIPSLEDFHINSNNFIVEDIYNIIKTNSIDDNFSNVYELIKDKIKQKNLDIEEVVRIFIIHNKLINDLSEVSDEDLVSMNIHFMEDSIKKSIGKDININDMYNKKSRSDKLLYYENLIQNNIIKEFEKTESYIEFKNIIGIQYTPFELEKIYFDIILEIELISLLEIFNKIKLTDHVPFSTCSNFYKIRKDIIPPLQWKYSDNSNIILKVLQKEDIATSIEDYADVIIEKDYNKIKAILSYTVFNNISKDEIINRFLSVIGNPKVTNIKEKEINGIFYFLNQRLNKIVLLDLIMNDSYFSNYLYIDETIITQKPTVYIHFYTQEIGEIKAYLTEKIVDKKDPDIKNKKEFFENSYYVRVKISKAKNLESIEKFQEILSKLFTLYNQKYENIIDIYSEFIPLNELETKLTIKNKKRVTKKIKDKREELAPEIFVSNYTRFCGQPPTIINDEDEENEIERGRQVLTFPKDASEGAIPRKYICEYKKYPYPGIKTNILSNSDKFPYLLCCYENDQTNKPEFRNYYYGEQLIDTTIDQHIIKSNKILNDKQVGYLPQNISKFFEIIDSDKNFEYYRVGVDKNLNSFLNCILFSLKLLNNTNIDLQLQNIRKTLATDELAASSKQELYDYTIEDIINKIKNTNEYFNPNYFIHLLEVKYNCNIFLFTRNKDNPDGTIVLPRHVKGYFKNKNNFNNNIFVYEHTGIEADNSKYPMCEIICRWNKKGKKDDLEYVFSSDNDLVKNAFEIFQNFNDFYILSKKFSYSELDFEAINLLSQSIDFYGKTRLLNIEHNGNKMTLFTSPLQPFKVKEENSFSVYKVTEEVANKFLSKYTIKNKKISNNILKCIIGNTTIRIPLIDSEIKSVSEYNSVILEYNKYKKLSRYITQYFFWIYSKFLKITNKQPSINNFEEFSKSYIIIDDKFNYGNVVNTFIANNNNIMLGNKLVLKSNETLDRLFYSLKLEIMRDPQKILLYNMKKYIDNYYIDVIDFDYYNFQIILKGDESLDNFIKINIQNDIQYIIYDHILKTSLSPYFFKNNIIGDTIYLAQNTTSIEKAIEIYNTWIKYKYNPLYNPKNSNILYNFLLYAYKNKNQIKPYYVNGENTPNLIKIIGYKVVREDVDTDEEFENYENKNFFTILLPLK